MRNIALMPFRRRSVMRGANWIKAFWTELGRILSRVRCKPLCGLSCDLVFGQLMTSALDPILRYQPHVRLLLSVFDRRACPCGPTLGQSTPFGRCITAASFPPSGTSSSPPSLGRTLSFREVDAAADHTSAFV